MESYKFESPKNLDERSKFANRVLKLIYQKHNGDLTAAVKESEPFFNDFEIHIRNIYELIPVEIPLYAYYELIQESGDHGEDNFGYTQEEYDEVKAKNPNANIKVGQESCVMLDPNYKGELIFEPLYRWLKEQNEQRKQGKSHELSKETSDLLDSCESGMTVDCHMELDEAEQELKEQIGKEILEKANR